MKQKTSPREPFALERLGSGALMQTQRVEELLACNETTAAYGLVLTPQQALSVEQARAGALAKTGRLEFGGTAAARLAEAFCDSPYLSPQNYEETLRELVGLFYEAKNDTWDRVADGDLIAFMKASFDGCCQGSLELLAGRELPRLARHIHEGGSFASFAARKEDEDADSV